MSAWLTILNGIISGVSFLSSKNNIHFLPLGLRCNYDLLKREKHSASPGDHNFSPSSTETGRAPLFLNGMAEAYISAGSLVFFSPRFNGQQKQDMLYSSLLAQLAASAEYNRLNETDKWYNFFNETMANIAWVTQSFEFHKYESRSDFLTISKVTQELLGGLPENEKELMTTVKETFDCLVKTPSTDVFTQLFCTNSISKHGGNFQIFVCDVDKTNQINVAGFYIYFHANEERENQFLISQRKQDIAIYYSTTILTLNERLYADIRDDVKDKLGERATTLVHKVPVV